MFKSIRVHHGPLLTITTLLAAAAAGAGAAVARRIEKAPDRHAPELLWREPDGDTVIVDREDGTRLRTVTAGDGRPVVLAHGYGVSLHEWNVVWQRLHAAG